MNLEIVNMEKNSPSYLLYKGQPAPDLHLVLLNFPDCLANIIFIVYHLVKNGNNMQLSSIPEKNKAIVRYCSNLLISSYLIDIPGMFQTVCVCARAYY